VADHPTPTGFSLLKSITAGQRHEKEKWREWAKGVVERGNKWGITSGRRGGGANFKNHERSNRRDLEGFRDELGDDGGNTISHPSPLLSARSLACWSRVQCHAFLLLRPKTNQSISNPTDSKTDELTVNLLSARNSATSSSLIAPRLDDDAARVMTSAGYSI